MCTYVYTCIYIHMCIHIYLYVRILYVYVYIVYVCVVSWLRVSSDRLCLLRKAATGAHSCLSFISICLIIVIIL